MTPERQSLRDYDPDPPTRAGALALSLAALAVTVLALLVVFEWTPIREWEGEQLATRLILDAFAVGLAAWVLARARDTWRRLGASSAQAPRERE